ncbi:TetR/AcrR family transcriptional regulator [Caulobacter sp.]|uniref:TetR/AcrR family transcriptional regulator n=1 Tax=Caulobacter sp. TaxID=78 RepID=UPI003BB0F35D
MSDGKTRPNQRRRTRKDLLEAAARLMKLGLTPNLEDIAQEALVSRATAYRYFPSVEALLLEAALDLETPSPEALFPPHASEDPLARLERLDAAMDEMMAANEASLRMMLANSMQRIVRGEVDGEAPPRQNRRGPLIEAALEPARDQFAPADLDRLGKALALIIGTEAMVVVKDVLQIDEAEARDVRLWAIRALVEAARK